ncbi:putative disease resistance protein [Vitis vinifera]|uniref:Putative disease resistance protein n=1 Tax=Vitis vinifera TaxID=29760 RepID=A0A438GAK3_VITVI|nr:putative disease resistance protein [Vitis vinifera]
MWVAEGIVTSMNEEKVEDIAERYLGELIDRCMVEVRARSLTGRVKTCRLHDLMRDLCLLKAKEQSFLQGIHLGHEKEPITVSSSSMVPVMPTGKLRRLSIFLGEHVDGFVPPKNENFSRLRSLLFFNAKDCRIRDWQWAKPVLEEFKLLRVLHLEGFKTEGELPKTIGSLIHLRYLSLKNSSIRSLPSSIGNLGCLRTLDLSFALEGYVPKIPNVMLKMLQLRHLYLPSKFTVTGATKLRLSDLCHLETLSLLDARKSNVKELVKLTSLHKLKIVSLESFEELEVIFNSPSPILNSLRSLSVEILDDRVEEGNLTQFLQACHNDFYRLSIDGALSKLPDPSKFKPNLSKLRLSRSKLLNDPMATLGKLPHLKVLELWDAYDGKKMRLTPGGELQKRYVSVMGERLLQVVGALREGCRDLLRGELLCGFFGVERDFLERKAVTEEGFIFLGEGENWREGDFFWSFLEGCFLEEKNLDSFAEEYPFSLRGRGLLEL